MNSKEIAEKVRKYHKEFSDEDWIELYKEMCKLEDIKEFRNHPESHFIANMYGSIIYKN